MKFSSTARLLGANSAWPQIRTTVWRVINEHGDSVYDREEARGVVECVGTRKDLRYSKPTWWIVGTYKYILRVIPRSLTIISIRN